MRLWIIYLMNSVKAQRVERNNKNNDKKVEFTHKTESLKKIQGETELEIENVGSQNNSLRDKSHQQSTRYGSQNH